MTLKELAQLFAIAAEVDPRLVPTRQKVLAWQGIVGDLDYEAAVKAMRAHYSRSRESLLPADLVDGVRELKAARRRPVVSDAERRVCRAAGIPPEEWVERRQDRGWVLAVCAKHGLPEPEAGSMGRSGVVMGNDPRRAISGAQRAAGASGGVA